jgi:hypothetical protein
MIDRPTSHEIENLIYRTQSLRDTWTDNAAYTRSLDIELHALRLLLFTTRIVEGESEIALSLGMERAADG